jgi:hypothetical protein
VPGAAAAAVAFRRRVWSRQTGRDIRTPHTTTYSKFYIGSILTTLGRFSLFFCGTWRSTADRNKKYYYCNATLAVIPTSLLSQLESVMNAAAGTIADLGRYDHISLSLAGLHWLRASERVVFKLAVLVYRCLHGPAPRYLAHQQRQVADKPSRRRPRSSSKRLSDVPPPRASRLLVIVPSLLLQPELETVYPAT